MSEISPLCDRCQVLRFDDKENGGTIKTSPTGEDYVSFGPNQRILLDYDLEDEFPDLPILSASSSRCALCSVIKDKILAFKGVMYPDSTNLIIHRFALFFQERIDLETDPDDPTGLLLDRFQVFFKLRGWHAVPDSDSDTDSSNETISGNDPESTTESSHVLQFGIYANPTDPVSKWLRTRRRPISPYALSEPGLERMKELLDEAFRLCDPTENQSSYLPTRLIEVGSDTQSPRLVASQEEVSNSSSRSKGKPPGFIALSYCWGPEQQASAQLKTTSENLHEHLQNIPLEKLPATISDAILVCRALDIQYIWVDALCIIQDDEHDWEKEAANMGKVYSNALVTIAVTTGDSCQSGFVKRRSVPCINIPFRSSLRPEISGEFLIRPLPSDEEVSFSIYTDNGFDVQELLDPNWQKDEFKFANFAFDNFAVDIEESAWNSRAWTFQETRLSPRILLFGDSMFHLSVGDFFQSEDGVQKDDIGLWGDDTSDSSDESEEEADEDSREADFQRKWESLVWSYSERSLTFQRDKLIAFSAIASHASTQTKGQYLAGLWSENLHRGLLWGHFGTDTTQKYLDPSREYTAPSWSWASQPDLVKWISDYDRTASTEMEVLSWNTTVGMDPYGRVRDGHIKILAKVCPIPATNIRHEIMSLGMTFPFELLSSEGEYLAQIRVDWRNQSDVAPVDPVTKEEKEDGPIERLFMVLIASRPYKESEMPSGEGKNRLYSDCLVQGLLLLPSENGNEYRRVGLFVSESRDLGGPRFWENIEMKEITLI